MATAFVPATAGGPMPYISRPREIVATFAGGLEPVEPRFGSISLWRTEGPFTGDPVDQWGFVAAKP
ncbi:hypothetical protein [Streptomyces sp. 372A]